MEHVNVHLFEARQGNSDIQNHPGHTHMQIGGTEVAALGHYLKFLMERCTIYRGERKMKSISLSFRISTTLETLKSAVH